VIRLVGALLVEINDEMIGRFAFQGGVRVSSSVQFGLPA